MRALKGLINTWFLLPSTHMLPSGLPFDLDDSQSWSRRLVTTSEVKVWIGFLEDTLPFRHLTVTRIEQRVKLIPPTRIVCSDCLGTLSGSGMTVSSRTILNCAVCVCRLVNGMSLWMYIKSLLFALMSLNTWYRMCWIRREPGTLTLGWIKGHIYCLICWNNWSLALISS